MTKGVFLRKVMSAAIIAAALLFGSGCTESAGGEQVAATVNGEAIPESVVTDYVEGYIDSLGYSSDQWAQYLGLEGKTAAEFRKGVIDYYVSYLLYEQKGRELGIEITDEQIDAAIEEAKQKLGRDEQGWVEYLFGHGYTPQTYRATLAYSLLVTAIQDREIAEPELSQDDRDEFADEHLLSYDGKHVWGIKFDLDDYARAEDVLKGILAADDQPAAFLEGIGSADGDAVASGGGDLSWSCIASYGPDWSELVKDLEEGKVYPYVYQSDDACYLLYCDAVYAPADFGDAQLALANMPDGIRAVYDEDMQRWAYTRATEQYTESLRDDADIVVNDMPSGLSYDVEPKEAKES